jgi:hypothetical protein
MPTLAPNQNDLTTLALVQAYLDPGSTTTWSTNQSNEMQALITAASRSVMNWTGRRALNRVVPFVDIMDGSGGYRQYLKDYPILKVSSVTVNGIAIAPGSVSAANGISPGYVIDSERESISIVGVQNQRVGTPYGPYSVSGTSFRNSGSWRFGTQDNSNFQNVVVQYVAGNTFVDSETTVITGGAYTVAYANNFAIDLGVLYSASAIPLASVASSPSQGQYSVNLSTGAYTFNAADNNAGVSIAYAYNGAPDDLAMAITKMVGVYWNRIKTIDQRSIMIPEGGTLTMQSWHVPPEVQLVIDFYTRHAVLGA